ncbi:MAG: LPS export ABC transporter permease LptF [Pseudomonadota bacterium]
MLGIVDRYVLREVATSWFAATGVLFAILLADRFARDLANAAQGDLPREALLLMLGLSSIYFLTILIPVGLFVAILMTLGRMYRDSEMAALLASGMPLSRLFRPLLTLALPTALLLAVLSLQVAPWAAQQAYLTSQRARQAAEVGLLEPGRFKAVSGGSTVFYAESIDKDGLLGNVFIQRRRGSYVEVAVAARGELRQGSGQDQRLLVLYEGQRVEGEPGTTNFREVSFREHGVPIELPAPAARSDNRQTYPTRELIGTGDTRDLAELQWRLSLPMAAFALTLLAVPLAKTRPRQGRYGTFVAALLIYVVYSNLLATGRSAVAQGDVPGWVGLWWVHGLFIAAGALWFAWQAGVFRRAPRVSTAPA